MVERLVLKPPSLVRQILERMGHEVTPADICPDRETLGRLYRTYPDLAGDKDTIDDGRCQSWRGNPGWWKGLVRK